MRSLILGAKRQQLPPFSAACRLSQVFGIAHSYGIGRFDERVPYRDDQYSSGGRGTLDKYIGDAIVAMYEPIPMEDHAYQSVKTALLMQAKQLELRDKWALEEEKWGKCYSLVKQMQAGSVAIREPLRLGTWGHWIDSTTP